MKITLAMQKLVVTICLLFVSIVLCSQGDNKSILVHGVCTSYGNPISKELESILFIKEREQLRGVGHVFTFTLNAESALELNASQIIVACINEATLSEHKNRPDTELEVIPLEGTIIYYCKKATPTPAIPRGYCGTMMYIRDYAQEAKMVKFRDFFWNNPDKPQFVPQYVLSESTGYQYTPQQIKALGSDIMIHPEETTRKGLEREIPLRTLAMGYLARIQQLAVGAPQSDNMKDWQNWYNKLPHQKIKFDKPDAKAIEYNTPALNDGPQYFRQDSLSRSIYQYYDTIYSYELDAENNFSQIEKTIGNSARKWSKELYNKELHEAIVAQLPPEVKVLPRYLPFDAKHNVVLALHPEGYQQKLSLYLVDHKTHKLSKRKSIYTYLPLDDRHYKMKIHYIFRAKDSTCVIVRFGDTIKWLVVNDNDLI